MKLDRIPLETTRGPKLSAVLLRRGAGLTVEDGATLDPATVGAVVDFLTSPRRREVLGELGEDQVDGVSWVERTPSADPDDLACSLSELAGRFGVAPVWFALVEDSDLVEAP